MTATIALPAAHAPARAQPDWHVRLLCGLFFGSGIPALTYQLVWQRSLFLIFGVNIESVTIVVTAFMLGLGLGGLAGGWLSKYARVPLLVLLAAIEALTGVFGVFSLAIFERAGDLVLGASLPSTALATLALVFLPTLLMGATLPLLVGHLVRRAGNVGGAVGLFYYANTLGAGAACLLCAAGLYPWLGMSGSIDVAAALNFSVAIGAIAAHAFGRRVARSEAAEVIGLTPAPMSESPWLPFAVVLVMSCVGGLVSLSHEIFFVRTMSYATGSSPFAWATTLGAFLIGLASGARLGAEACESRQGDALLLRLLRSVLVATAIGIAFLPALARLAPYNAAMFGGGLLFIYLLARQWGLVLPCLAHLGVAADRRAGMRTGLLYLANIVGSVAGSVLTGFVLMDRLSLLQIAQLLGAAGLACAVMLVLVLRWSLPARLLRAALIVSAAAVVWGLPAASGKLLEALFWKSNPEGAYSFAQVIENRSGIVAVDRSGTVFGNGAYDGHFNVDLVNDVNGIIRPYALSLFHPAPRDVLMIGFASGSWAQVLANNPAVASLTIVEINPAYAELVASNPSVATVLKNPKVRLVTDDGRRWLRLHADRRFDAIVTNTTFHFRAHATNLLSADYLALLKPHLNPGGIVFYNTTGSDRVQRTGCAGFSHGARFTNHMLLSERPIDWNFARWRQVLEAYRIDGRAMLDLTRPEHREGLQRLMALEGQTRLDAAPSPNDAIESCPHVLARTAGLLPVTDDNMGTEWRSFWAAGSE